MMKQTWKRGLLLLLILCMAVFTLASCGSSGKDDPEGGPAAQNGEVNGKDDGDDDIKIDLTETKDKFVWQIETQTFVYYHDGEKVTGYEIYLDLENKEDAENMYNLYQMTKKDNEQLKDVKKKGTYVILVYNESGFPYKTYDEVKQASEFFKSLNQN